jgi:DNA polymerase-4
MSRVVAHLDLDAFFAAVEVIERPELRGLPLVVGGDPFGRGVVSTASYEARQFGIHSAMSAAEARRRCPEAIFVRPDMAAYGRHSEAVWRLVETRCAAVQRLGLDEGYLDLAGVVGSARTAERFLVDLQAAIHAGTGLSASFGCGTSKVVAKVASDFRKPAGVTVVAAGQEAAFLAPLPLRALPGIGPKADARLRARGLATIGDLADLPDDRLRLLLPGVVGVELRDRARGIDRRRVESAGPVESVGHEETFDADVHDPAVLADEAVRMAARVADRLGRTGRVGRTVTVKLRYPDFTPATRSQTTGASFGDAEEIGRLALLALERALADRPPPVRLLGVTVSKLSVVEQLRLPV